MTKTSKIGEKESRGLNAVTQQKYTQNPPHLAISDGLTAFMEKVL